MSLVKAYVIFYSVQLKIKLILFYGQNRKNEKNELLGFILKLTGKTCSETNTKAVLCYRQSAISNLI